MALPPYNKTLHRGTVTVPPYTFSCLRGMMTLPPYNKTLHRGTVTLPP